MSVEVESRVVKEAQHLGRMSHSNATPTDEHTGYTSVFNPLQEKKHTHAHTYIYIKSIAKSSQLRLSKGKLFETALAG